MSHIESYPMCFQPNIIFVRENECGVLPDKAQPRIHVIYCKPLSTCAYQPKFALLGAGQILVFVHLSLCFVECGGVFLYQVILSDGMVCFNVVV